MTKKILDVDGITCAHCVNTIRDAVSKLVGISLRVEVDIGKKQVAVEFDERQAKIEEISDKIIEVGFEVKM